MKNDSRQESIPIKVILVEDNPDHRKLIRNSLEKSEIVCQVEEVGSGEECLSKLSTREYSVVILDYNLPKMNSLDVLSKINKTGTDIPVIMVTGLGDDKTAVEAMKNGAYGYIAKSKDYLVTLPYVVKNVVERHRLKTERERLTKETARAKYYTDNIMKSMVDPLIVLDPDTKIKAINKATADLLGYTEEELINKPVAAIFEEEEEKEALFKGARMKKLIEEGSIRDYEMTYKTKSGEKSPVSFSGSVMKDEEGNLIGTVGVARDMREIKRLMRELAASTAAERKKSAELEKTCQDLRKTREQLIQAGKMAAVGQLGAGVAHEFNNPLGIILDYSQIAGMELKKKSPDKTKLKRAIRAIDEESHRCKRIIQSLLTFSRPAEMEFKPIDVNKIVEETFFLMEYQLAAQNIKLIKTLKPELPKVIGNANQLQQVFTNIILNARQSMPDGGECAIATDSSPEEVRIIFDDTGCGIPRENLGRLFEPFFTDKKIWKGIGLGLSISWNIIQDHGGRIDVQSEVGKGSAFTVILPIAK